MNAQAWCAKCACMIKKVCMHDGWVSLVAERVHQVCCGVVMLNLRYNISFFKALPDGCHELKPVWGILLFFALKLFCAEKPLALVPWVSAFQHKAQSLTIFSIFGHFTGICMSCRAVPRKVAQQYCIRLRCVMFDKQCPFSFALVCLLLKYSKQT